jgi:Acetyltransferase (GNAT) domain
VSSKGVVQGSRLLVLYHAISTLCVDKKNYPEHAGVCSKEGSGKRFGKQARTRDYYLPSAYMLAIYQIDPLQDPRWCAFLQHHADTSVFHTAEWLKALRCTYGYKPFVFTTSPPGSPLTNGVLFCEVHSWLTGHRLVSLPFSDHCEPLADNNAVLEQLLGRIGNSLETSRWKYIELRPLVPMTSRHPVFKRSSTFCFHKLDLRPNLDNIFRSFHKDCVQRKIKRSEREGLHYEEGRSESLLIQFHRLLVLTRRRQHLPPQPVNWFRNLISCMGDKLKIRLASKNGYAIAGILTIRGGTSLVYKYGSSDKDFSNLGGMHLLFWHAIQEAKNDGLIQFDMGRSDWDNTGLIDFKDRWGATRSEMVYLRYPAKISEPIQAGAARLTLRIVKQMFALAPEKLATTVGRVLYRHLG